MSGNSCTTRKLCDTLVFQTSRCSAPQLLNRQDLDLKSAKTGLIFARTASIYEAWPFLTSERPSIVRSDTPAIGGYRQIENAAAGPAIKKIDGSKPKQLAEKTNLEGDQTLNTC